MVISSHRVNRHAPTDDQLQQEIERLLEEIDGLLEDALDLTVRRGRRIP